MRVYGGHPLIMASRAIDTCDACRRPAGRSYPSCPACAATLDAPWDAAWSRFARQHPGIDTEVLVDFVLARPQDHQWPIVDGACWRSRCRSCETPLGLGMPGCPTCDALIEAVYAAQPAAGDARHISALEHDLRIARWLLRSPYRTSPGQAARWRSLVPALIERRAGDAVAARGETVRRAYRAR